MLMKELEEPQSSTAAERKADSILFKFQEKSFSRSTGSQGPREVNFFDDPNSTGSQGPREVKLSGNCKGSACGSRRFLKGCLMQKPEAPRSAPKHPEAPKVPQASKVSQASRAPEGAASASTQPGEEK